jgi:hypothetical protein
MSTPHTIGIQNPGLSELAKPIKTEITEKKTRYNVKRERNDMTSKRAIFFIMKPSLLSVCRGILPLSSRYRQFLCSSLYFNHHIRWLSGFG